MSTAWHTAAFTRAKRMPPFNKAINPDGKVKSRDDLVNQLKARFGGMGMKRNG